MAMRGTTPTFIAKALGVDLTGKTVYLTIKQNSKLITKTNKDILITPGPRDSMIAFTLTQEEMLGFEPGSAKVQIRFIDKDERAFGTGKGSFYIDDILLDGVIKYGGGD